METPTNILRKQIQYPRGSIESVTIEAVGHPGECPVCKGGGRSAPGELCVLCQGTGKLEALSALAFRIKAPWELVAFVLTDDELDTLEALLAARKAHRPQIEIASADALSNGAAAVRT